MLKVGTARRLRDMMQKSTLASSLGMSEADSTESARQRAEKAQVRRNWTDARDLWHEVVRQNPGDLEAWIQLGNMLNELADYSASLHAFGEASRLAPDYFPAMAGQAGVHERAGAWQEARDAWLSATQLTSDPGQQAHAYSHAVLAAHLAGDFERLSRTIMQATAASPGFLDHPDNLPLRAKLLRLDQPDTAKQLLRQRLTIVPGDNASRFDFASICLDDGDYLEGLAVLEPCVAVGDIPSSFLWLAADLHERLHQLRSVLEVCDRVVAAGLPELRFVQRGFDVAVRLGDLISARRYAIRFSVIAQGELGPIDQLRAAYENVGDVRRAALLCRWISRRWPHSEWHLGQSIRLVAATSGLLAADRLTQQTIARHGHSVQVDNAYCYSAFVANEPAEAHRRFAWYLASPRHDNTEVQVMLGYVLANAVGIQEAERHFLSVAASNFQTKGALIGLAHMASRRRDQRATMECWSRVAAMYPGDTIARVEHARAVYNYGDHAGARHLCERALRVLPSDTTMGEFYVWLLVATGDDAAAQVYLPKFQQLNGPSWDALEAAALSAGRLGLLERDWSRIKQFLPSASHATASSRLYHTTRLLLYFEKPRLADALINLANIEKKHTAWLAPYLDTGHLAVAPELKVSARSQWRQIAGQVTDAPARRLDAMSAEAVQAILRRPAHDQPTVHIINKFEQPRGGSELHALDLAARLARHATVELWAPEMPHPSFSANQNVQAVDRSQGRAPYGGVFVFIGIYFPINWIAFCRPQRIIFLYNTFEAPALHARVLEAASLTGVSVELLFCSDLIGAECGLPGLFEPSPIDINLFSAAPPADSEVAHQRQFTIGRHSRDVMEKHHLEDKAVYSTVTASGGRSIVLGGMCMRSAFLPDPSLDLLPARTTGIVEFLRGLDVFFYRTSTWVEPWGRVVVEAMACEIPVLVHDVGGYAQIIKHEENGLLFHTTSEAVQQVKRLQADPALRKRLAQAGRATVEFLLSDASLARLTAFYMLEP